MSDINDILHRNPTIVLTPEIAAFARDCYEAGYSQGMWDFDRYAEGNTTDVKDSGAYFMGTEPEVDA
ncbi:hypothetical protein FHW84_001807 [Dyella sp. SG562]|uniref:hypothetical protein n=1 Tax=Dyella sp. SG562 TaxID=2587017 RepID=UPI0014206587|nr:hypothetical protein [Dyella sp. SG562]NII73238.1 hypothetical protein [Dyella sp. SG562]